MNEHHDFKDDVSRTEAEWQSERLAGPKALVYGPLLGFATWIVIGAIGFGIWAIFW